jgi:hypothetical protein
MGLPMYALYRMHFPDAGGIQTALVAVISAQFGLIYFNN